MSEPDTHPSTDRSRSLASLFERVTGVEEVVDEQHPTPSSRYLEGDSPAAVVTQLAKDDGLEDAIDTADGATPD